MSGFSTLLAPIPINWQELPSGWPDKLCGRVKGRCQITGDSKQEVTKAIQIYLRDVFKEETILDTDGNLILLE